MRTLINSGIADLHRPAAWTFAHVRAPELQTKYKDIIERLEDSLDFMKVVGGESRGALNTVDIWTSHEVSLSYFALVFFSKPPHFTDLILFGGTVEFQALMLEYEEGLIRGDVPDQAHRARGLQSDVFKPVDNADDDDQRVPLPQLPAEVTHATSAHFLWIGDRTRQLDHAHLEFLRGVSNPIGIKLGPNMKAEELMDILDLINPRYEEGKVVLICRFGVDHVERCLSACIKAVKSSPHRHSIFVCDPMHGNTKSVESLPGVKTRYTGKFLNLVHVVLAYGRSFLYVHLTTLSFLFLPHSDLADIAREIKMSIQIHSDNDSRLGGVHLEMTGELDEDGYSVTECLGGSMGLKSEHLSLNYQVRTPLICFHPV